MYELARLIYNGARSDRAISQAISHLKAAIAAGHLPSVSLMSRIYTKERLGLRGQLAAYWLQITKIPAAVCCLWRYPGSDRIRSYGTHFDA
jgi:TPR repeat protein